jgi:hypothetical protein
LAKRLQDAVEAATKGQQPGLTLTRARQRWSLGQYVNQMREVLKEPSQAEPATKAEPVPVAVGPASRASDDLLQRVADEARKGEWRTVRFYIDKKGVSIEDLASRSGLSVEAIRAAVYQQEGRKAV